MRVVLAALVLMAGLVDLIIVGSFLVTPHDSAELARAAHGLSIIRAHCTSFFSVAALAMIAGVLWRNGDLLLVPTFIFIGALVERLVNFVAFGPYPEWLLPMALDVAHIALLLAARRAFRQANEDEAAAPATPHRANLA
ncbi:MULTISPECIES: hypothetical protein [unclassified Novosphingobium]|uniref:hypothetical protein n=1 Tax=Novosphingobium TaxID=165696 RepID=UPI00146B1F0D|nr:MULTISPECIES: hypothetical protein [unclassified Novosphingobium]NMN05855.1 hypothetical protein [Novosphingobium sp. SG919]NMN87785.1 hypothetical protein [Novosphingobium sp. SG916]